MDLLAHFRLFVDISDQGSLARAARLRGMAPSAVTASLQRLEQHVGARLMQRSSRRLRLTAEGEHLLGQCRRILDDIEDVVDQVAANSCLQGWIRLTSIHDFGRTRLPGLIDGFLLRHPGIRFDLSLSDEVVDLGEGRYDLGIRTGPLDESRLHAELILRSGRSVCASPAYWQRHGKPQHPDELRRHNCLVLARPGQSASRWPFQIQGQPCAVPVAGNRMANDGGLLRQWAIAGAGVILKSDYDVAADLQAGRLETALDDYRCTEVHLYAVHTSGRHISQRCRAFIDYLIEQL